MLIKNIECKYRQSNVSGVYSFLNPFSYLKIRKHKEIFSEIDGFYIDGIFLVKFLNLFLGKKIQRVSFDMTSIAPEVFSDADKNNKKVAIIGSDIDSNDKFIKWVNTKYPQLEVVFYRNGYFSEYDEVIDACNKIVRSKAGLVIVGMGAIHQESFLVTLKKSGFEGLGFTCGGFIHQTASAGSEYYPEFFDKWNLRWVYRIYDEPKLFKRYFTLYPLAILFLVKDILFNGPKAK